MLCEFKQTDPLTLEVHEKMIPTSSGKWSNLSQQTKNIQKIRHSLQKTEISK